MALDTFAMKESLCYLKLRNISLNDFFSLILNKKDFYAIFSYSRLKKNAHETRSGLYSGNFPKLM